MNEIKLINKLDIGGINVNIRKGMEQARFKTSLTAETAGAKTVYAVQCTAQCNEGDAVIASFNVTLTTNSRKTHIDFSDVHEADGYYLFSVELPNVAVLGGEGAYIAVPCGNGRLIDVNASDFVYPYQIDSLNPVLFGCLYNSRQTCAIETDSIENRLICKAGDIGGERCGSFSVEFIHRLHEFELIEYGHRVDAISEKYYLKVQDGCRFTLTLESGIGLTWQDCVKNARKNVKVADYYSDKIIGKICADNGTGEWRLTFEDIEALIKDYAALTNNQPAVFYLVGWQYDGHDTGYPAIDKVNEKLGGYSALKKLIETARNYNVEISFHDNYDDAYPNSPDWEPQFIARDAGGGMMKCGLFVQGQAYLINNHTYSKERVPERVRKTAELYSLHSSYHIDVLAGAYKAGRRYDFNPDSPASARQNLDGKLTVISEFAKYGLDVTTEDFSSLFIGAVSHFWHISRQKNMSADNLYIKGAEPIPLIPFMYHAQASYGLHDTSPESIITALIYGACFSADITNTNFSECISMYYLLSMPWTKLYGKNMTRYERHNDTVQVTYEDGSTVKADFSANTYSVTVDNEIISANFTTLIQQRDGVYLAYSKDGGLVTYPLPKPLRNKTVTAFKLTLDGGEAFDGVTIGGDTLTIAAEPNTAYKILY